MRGVRTGNLGQLEIRSWISEFVSSDCTGISPCATGDGRQGRCTARRPSGHRALHSTIGLIVIHC